MADKSSEAMNVSFLINTKTGRIVCAEAGKEFVDFLFSCLSMPIGSVLKLVNESDSNKKIGSISNLYESMEKLPSLFMSTDKSQLLDPKFITSYSNNPLKIEGGKYYGCSYQEPSLNVHCYLIPAPEIAPATTHNLSSSNTDMCVCGSPINRPFQLRQNTNSNTNTSGYVKEVATFIITDDLKIRGSSTRAIMPLLNQLNIKDLTKLEERVAIVDRKKALKLLEASLVSTTVLSDAFGAEFPMEPRFVLD